MGRGMKYIKMKSTMNEYLWYNDSLILYGLMY